MPDAATERAIEEVAASCCVGNPRRVLPDGRILELLPMAFGNVRLTITLPELDGEAYEDGWCYHREGHGKAWIALLTWDGEGEPQGWNKHPFTGRYRRDGTPESEINQHEAPAARVP